MNQKDMVSEMVKLLNDEKARLIKSWKITEEQFDAGAKPVNYFFFKKKIDCMKNDFSQEFIDAWFDRNPEFFALLDKQDFPMLTENQKVSGRRMLKWLWKLNQGKAKDHKLDDYEQIPSSDVVLKYVKLYEYKDNPPKEEISVANYQKDFKTVAYLKSILGESNTREAVAIKACVVNTLYSTRSNDLSALTDYISRIDFLKDVQTNDIDEQAKLINSITNIPGVSKNYSFATKFCHLHNPDFAIYDSFAAGMIMFVHKRYQIIDCQKMPCAKHIKEIIPTPDSCKQWSFDELRSFLQDYKTYKTAILRIREAYNLIDPETSKFFTIDQMDKYLWGLGRAHDISDRTVDKVQIR